MVVAAAVHNGEESLLVEALEADHRRVEPEAIGNLDDMALGNSELRSDAVVLRIAIRNHRVQAVVASRELEHHENPLRVLLEARSLQCLRGQRRRRPVEEERQPGAESQAVHPSDEEVAAGTPTMEP